MVEGIRDLIIHPDAFFARITKERPRLIPPFLIIMAGASVNIVGLVLTLVLADLIHIGKIGNLTLESALIYYLIAYGIVPLIYWGILAAGFYGLSRVVSGKGSLTATFQNAGYGMLPWILFAAVSSVYAIASLLIENPIIPFMQIIEGGTTPPLICFLAGFGFFLWMLYLWILGMKYTHQITFRKAAGVTAIPAIIILVLDSPAWVIAGKFVLFGMR